MLDYRITRLIRPLHKMNPAEPEKWPKVSLIIPACNEAETLEEAVRSKLECDYPDLEIILIDDRSSDTTGEIIDRLSLVDNRIKAVHISELPEGWLGKPHALTKGLEVATGDWYLFTDADVHFSNGSIKKTIAYCEEMKIDQLGVLPKIRTDDLLLNAVLLTYIRLFSLLAGFWGLCKPKSSAFTGVGAFNLVRRSAYEKTEGMEWLKLEIVDDVGLGMLIKRSGGHVSIVNGINDLKIVWYPGIREMTVGLEKGTYSTLGNFSLRRTAFWALLFLAVELSPIAAMLMIGIIPLQILGVVAWVVGLATSIRMAKWSNMPMLPAFFFPLGAIIFTGMLLRAGWVGWRRDGIVWRGTYYSCEVLREGKRFRLP